MKTIVVSFVNGQSIKTGIRVLRSGGVVGFPTDTVYGVAVSAFDPKGISKLYEIKGRSFNKAIAVLVGDLSQVEEISSQFPVSAMKLAAAFWPGALTLVVPKKPELPTNLTSFPTVGVRMPDHGLLRKFLREAGPLATTSANLSGGQNCLSAQEVLMQLDGRIDLLLDGGTTGGDKPSTVVDCTKEKVAILRVGDITENEIRSVLQIE
jgi:L-threonylcarbamoyladenylate synthase